MGEKWRITEFRLTQTRCGRILLHLIALSLEPFATTKRCHRHLAGILREIRPLVTSIRSMIQTLLQVAITEKPAVVGWLGGGIGFATAGLEQAREVVSLTAGVLGCLATLAAIVYTVARCYYLIRNKGKEN